MSESMMPPKSPEDALLDDLSRSYPIFVDTRPKIGGDEKTPLGEEFPPVSYAARNKQLRVEVQALNTDRLRLAMEYETLIALGVDPSELEAIEGVDMAKLNNPLLKYKWDGKIGGKDSNPKDAIGSRKAGLSMIPRQVLYELGLAMLEGLLKYARHNYRIAGVRASVYIDACDRHLDAWWEGQDTDPGSGLNHIIKAIASLVVLRDSMITGNWYDDRPPSIGDPNWMAHMNKEAERIIDAFKGEPKRPFIKGDNE